MTTVLVEINVSQCFRYILNNPPRPLTSWDIWFQLGHVHEQDRDVNTTLAEIHFKLTCCSTKRLETHTCGFSRISRTTQRFCNSLAGSIISQVHLSWIKTRLCRI